jgi:hypothetical protein
VRTEHFRKRRQRFWSVPTWHCSWFRPFSAAFSRVSGREIDACNPVLGSPVTSSVFRRHDVIIEPVFAMPVRIRSRTQRIAPTVAGGIEARGSKLLPLPRPAESPVWSTCARGRQRRRTQGCARGGSPCGRSRQHRWVPAFLAGAPRSRRSAPATAGHCVRPGTRSIHPREPCTATPGR